MVVRDFTVVTEERLCGELQKSVDEAEALVGKLEKSQHTMANHKGLRGEISRAKSLKGEREKAIADIREAFAAARETDSSYVQNTQRIGGNLDRYLQFVKSLTATIQGNVSAADIHAQLDGDATEFKKSIVYKGESKTPPEMTDEDYYRLSDFVYKVKDEDFSYKPGDVVESHFRVIAVTDEGNGMQAIAVAPIVDGHTDTDHIVVAYAGTKELHDFLEDGREVAVRDYDSGGQLKTARDFYREVQKQYPNSHISTTGHSLGGFLAMHMAGENHVPSTVFNAPDVAGHMSEEDKNWVKAHHGDYKNFVVLEDAVGNFRGNELGIAVYTGNRDNGLSPFTPHYQNDDNFQFDDSGKLQIQHSKFNVGTVMGMQGRGAGLVLEAGLLDPLAFELDKVEQLFSPDEINCPGRSSENSNYDDSMTNSL